MRIENGRIKKTIIHISGIMDFSVTMYGHHLIMQNYKRSVPPDYKRIINRLEELREIVRNNDLIGLRGRNGFAEGFESRVAEDRRLLDFLKEQNGYCMTKKRVIFDFSSNGFSFVREDEANQKDRVWPRTLFCER